MLQPRGPKNIFFTDVDVGAPNQPYPTGDQLFNQALTKECFYNIISLWINLNTPIFKCHNIVIVGLWFP